MKLREKMSKKAPGQSYTWSGAFPMNGDVWLVQESGRIGCRHLQCAFRITNPDTQSIGITNPDELENKGIGITNPDELNGKSR